MISPFDEESDNDYDKASSQSSSDGVYDETLTITDESGSEDDGWSSDAFSDGIRAPAPLEDHGHDMPQQTLSSGGWNDFLPADMEHDDDEYSASAGVWPNDVPSAAAGLPDAEASQGPCALQPAAGDVKGVPLHIAKDIVLLEATNHCSLQTVKAAWHSKAIATLQSTDEHIPGYAALRGHLRAQLPTVLIDLDIEENSTHAMIHERDLAALPFNKYRDTAKYTIHHCMTHVPVLEVVALHRRLHPHLARVEAVLSQDGVQEDRSSGRCLNVISLQFVGCSSVYPISILQSSRGKKRASEEYLGLAIDELVAANVAVTHVCADAPMRAHMRGFTTHSGFFGCDKCTERGASEKGRVHYPYKPPAARAPPRSHEQTLAIVSRLHELDKEERLGVQRASPLVRLRGFDIISGVPPEYMHSVCLGIVKKLFELTFSVSAKPGLRLRRMAVDALNVAIRDVKLPSEFHRCIRPVHYSDYKASEWRTFILVLTPYVVDCLDNWRHEATGRRDLWLLLCYTIRAFTLSRDYYAGDAGYSRCVDLVQRFYKLFDSVFTSPFCSYNVHLLLHLHETVLQYGPLTATSAFAFEGFYAELKHNYVAGTQSPGKQALSKIYVKRAFAKHHCSRRLTLTQHETLRTCDCLVLRSNRHFYYIHHRVSTTRSLTGRRVRKYPWRKVLRDGHALDFADVGVFRFAFVEHEEVSFSEDEVIGKGVLLEGAKLIVAVTTNILLELN